MDTSSFSFTGALGWWWRQNTDHNVCASVFRPNVKQSFVWELLTSNWAQILRYSQNVPRISVNLLIFLSLLLFTIKIKLNHTADNWLVLLFWFSVEWRKSTVCERLLARRLLQHNARQIFCGNLNIFNLHTCIFASNWFMCNSRVCDLSMYIQFVVHSRSCYAAINMWYLLKVNIILRYHYGALFRNRQD